MIQFYAPDIESDNILPEVESGHCCRVLRKKEGDEVIVTDGKGKRFRCVITHAHPKHTEVELISIETIDSSRNYTLTIAVAPTKNNDRIEWLLEKAIEIGVDKFVFLRCDRSERKVINLERLEKVAVSAMKQCQGVRMPELSEMTDIRKFIDSRKDFGENFFGYCSKEFPRLEFVKEYKGGGDIAVMIGPEGDFTLEEVEKAVKNGFKPVTFGESRLRTETAALYAVAAVAVINQLN